MCPRALTPRICRHGQLLIIWGLFFTPAAWAHPGTGIVVDRQGQIYFVNGIPNRILKIDRAGKLTIFFVDKEGTRLSNPHHLILDQKDNLYCVGDRMTPVWKFGPDGQPIQVYPPTDWFGIGIIGTGGDPFTIDAQGNLYCLNYRQFKHTQILKISPDGRIGNFAGGDWGFADGKGSQAQFRNLHGSCFAWGPQRALYLTDDGSSIRKITADGTVTTLAGGAEPGFADGQGKMAKFRYAMGLTFDGQGSGYVADAGNRRIRKVSPDGNVTTLAGSGMRGAADGPVREASFDYPSGVAVDRDGTVYVLEYIERTGKYRVRRISSDRKVTTVVVVD